MEESLETRVAVLCERVQNLLDRLEDGDERFDKLEERVDDLEGKHNERISELEKTKYLFAGACAFAGAVMGWLGDLVLHALTK